MRGLCNCAKRAYAVGDVDTCNAGTDAAGNTIWESPITTCAPEYDSSGELTGCCNCESICPTSGTYDSYILCPDLFPECGTYTPVPPFLLGLAVLSGWAWPANGCVTNNYAQPVEIWNNTEGCHTLGPGESTPCRYSTTDIDHVKNPVTGQWWKIGDQHAIVTETGRIVGARCTAVAGGDCGTTGVGACP
jgi:hypothetical protein